MVFGTIFAETFWNILQQVRIYTKNKNDEEPKFSQGVYTPNVDENAGPNTLVTTVVASDKDGDNVRFGFVGGGARSGQFVIEELTGVIRLHNGPINLDRSLPFFPF